MHDKLIMHKADFVKNIELLRRFEQLRFEQIFWNFEQQYTTRHIFHLSIEVSCASRI